VCTRNCIRGHSRIHDSGQLITSSSEVTSVVEKAKTLTAKEKTGEFKSQREIDQLSIALDNEEHRSCTRAISSIASQKEGFADEIHMHKKRKTQEIAHNAEETFVQQFFNFMIKTHNMLCRCLVQKSVWISVPLFNNPLL
jgi:phosphoenolpyruvate carboxylase